MNKAELIEELAGRLDGNRRAAGHALESVLDVITRAVVKGEKVVITGFGSFEAVTRGARTARNPRTGETVKVKKTTVPKFKPGAELKAIVKGDKKLPKAPASSAAAPAKKSATKATAKKSAAKKSTAKKSTAKKAPAKKAPVRKTAAKKAPAKKSTAKKTARKR